MADVSSIDKRLAEINRRLSELEDETSDLENEADDLQEAKKTILRYLGNNRDSQQPLSTGVDIRSLSAQQQTVFRNVPVGASNKRKAAEIVKLCRSLDPAYVRTTLWRLSQTDRICGESGFYWRKA